MFDIFRFFIAFFSHNQKGEKKYNKKMKNKCLKEGLIQNYISLLEADNFCTNCNTIDLTENEKSCLTIVRNFSQELLQTYKKVLFKFDLMDLSLSILYKELVFFNENDNFSFTKLQNCYISLKTIEENLEKNLKKMKLNVFELNYLNIDKLSKFTHHNFLFS